MDSIKFRVNGVERIVGSEISSDVTLLDYLRNYLELRGTKYMCREGGCGACIVTASKTPGTPHIAINSADDDDDEVCFYKLRFDTIATVEELYEEYAKALSGLGSSMMGPVRVWCHPWQNLNVHPECLVTIGSCDGWDILTIEGLGNKKTGYHTLQKTLAENNGTQCGYCSCGWVMAMHGILESKTDLTMKEIENSFGSNICRCTGYRPILDAFKKFATDAPKEDRIMGVGKLSICKNNGKCCNDEEDWCMVNKEDAHMNKVKVIRLKDGKTWFKARVLQDIFNIFAKEGTDSYMLVGGNTAKVVSPISEYPRIMIDISKVQELKTVQYDQNIIIGAATTLTEFQHILKTKATGNFSYFSQLHYHVKLVAHIPVQNIGTTGGNLMIKHADNMFQSDIFLLLETVGAKLTIVDQQQRKYTVSLVDFLKLDMKGKVIVNIMFPPLSDKHKIYTYKLMSRAQSVHAIVNAGFLYELDPITNVVQSARIVYGALSKSFTRASATEAYLIGKPLFTNETLQGAMGVLNGEMIVEDNPPEPSVEYRRYLACALFYKGLLTLCTPEIIQNRLNSGTVNLHDVRPVSTGLQDIQTDPTLWPLSQPIMKDEALIQCAGEAKFTEDIPALPDQVYGAFVLSTVALGIIVSIDASPALALPGVLAFYTAKDIPGLNSFMPDDISIYANHNEEILCDGKVKYFNQPIGIIVAETFAIAARASKLVQIKYSNVTIPVIDIKDAIKDSTRSTLLTSFEATNPGTDVFKTISGSNTLYGQYHFPMETLVCIAKPTEEGLEVHSTTQYLDGVHTMISRSLNMDASKIDVHVRRLGGAYGLKISRGAQATMACSLIAQKLQRPCRFILPLTTVMQTTGKRTPCISVYEVKVNNVGLIQSLDSSMYEDNGYIYNEMISTLGIDVYNNCYDKSKINHKIYDTVTDMASNTFCRSPGTLETISGLEHIMERISYELSVDPVEVRLTNTDPAQLTEMKNVLETLKTNAEYISRRAAVNSFNKEKRWKKRGLRFAFVKWVPTGAQRLNINLSVFRVDGTVAITHAGVEMGQGINTKAKQIAAYLLNMSVDKIQIKANNTTVAPNSFLTGGSLTTTSVMIGLRRCCEELNARLEPIRATLNNPTWEQLIAAASNADVNLQAHGYAGFNDIQTYDVYGMALCEVELDILTNEFEILRVDLLQDVGLSINPDIDIGQVEGAFIMGLGYWTCEKLAYTEEGQILTDRTWNYHVPMARDIPQDFRVYLKKNSYSNDFIMGSKATGEPALCASVAVAFAIREAMVEARKELGIPSTEWFSIDGPYSGENIHNALKTNIKDFRFY